MEHKKHSKISKRTIVIMVIIIVLILLGVVVSLKLFGKQRQAQDGNSMWNQGLNEMGGQDWMQSLGETEGQTADMVVAYGITSIGVTENEFPIENLESRLELEEVYVTSGDTIEEGTALFKLTEESVLTVKTELEKTLREADLAYRAGYIEYEQSKISAYYDKENTLLAGEQAAAIYEETVSGLYDNVARAKEELDTAKEQIAEYEAAIANNTYYEDYQVEYYKNLYDENLEILKKRVDEWGVSWSEVISGGGGGNMTMRSTQMPSVSGGDAGGDLHSQYVTVLASLYNILEQNLADYEQALSDYEDASENAGFNLQTLKLSLSSLEKKYAEALENYETSILQAELTKETTLSNAEKAENNYETSIEKAEADFEELTDAKEEAESNLAIFNRLIQDNCYYAQDSGEILRMSVRNGSEIGAGSRLYTLSNTGEMTVTVSVSQEDIAKIQVGDSAMVQSTESGMYNGIVTAISPISSSTSKTSITYSVTVQLSGELSNLETNETVYVYFGMGKGA